MPAIFRRFLRPVLLLVFVLIPALSPAQSLRFEISFPSSQSAKPLDGHILLGISTSPTEEPRFQLREEEAQSAQFFGLDVDALAPDSPAVIDSTSLGYPLRSLSQLPAGDYYVQAVLNIYATYRRNGHIIKLPPDQGEGQLWYSKPGNLLNKPLKVHIDPTQSATIKISLAEKIPPIAPAADTKYLKHIRIQSKLLSDFWGTPTYLGAVVLLPEGFDEHPKAHYPLLIDHGHFEHDFNFFRAEGPAFDPNNAHDLSYAQYAHRFYQEWTSGRLPHMLIVLIQHANPYYDDSYAVNSANLGPYGDAITQELIPEIEKRFRGIGQPWARALAGGSTGGWEAAAQQIFYPDFFNDAYVACPDPIDFRAYQLVNIYENQNAFYDQGPFGKVPRGEMRTSTGEIQAVMEPTVRREEVMGTHGRSTEQFGIWQAVFSPVGPDGYPASIWNPTTGAIDPNVAAYWKEHYDLRSILERDISTLGPKLAGKLHFAVGDADTWYLNNAVHLMQQLTDSHRIPYRIADYEFSPGKAHCYQGGGDVSTLASYGTLYQRILPRISQRMRATAPANADTSWLY